MLWSDYIHVVIGVLGFMVNFFRVSIGGYDKDVIAASVELFWNKGAGGAVLVDRSARLDISLERYMLFK